MWRLCSHGSRELTRPAHWQPATEAQEPRRRGCLGLPRDLLAPGGGAPAEVTHPPARPSVFAVSDPRDSEGRAPAHRRWRCLLGTTMGPRSAARSPPPLHPVVPRGHHARRRSGRNYVSHLGALGPLLDRVSSVLTQSRAQCSPRAREGQGGLGRQPSSAGLRLPAWGPRAVPSRNSSSGRKCPLVQTLLPNTGQT